MSHRPTREDLEAMDIDDLDRLAFGHAGGDVVSVHPDDVLIRYECDLGNPAQDLANGGLDWAQSVDLSEPIEVTIQNDGRMYLEDGHHRWTAAKATERTLLARIEIKGKPIDVILARQASEDEPEGVGQARKRKP